MGESLTEAGKARLERSCELERDWVLLGTGADGIERMEAFFRGYAYDPHRHDTYAFGLTLSGVQSFDYRGARRDSLNGQAIVLHPDEVHNGRSGIESGFRYRMLYVEPRLIRQAMGEGGRALPFVSTAVSQEPSLVAAIAHALHDLDQPLDPLAADDLVERLAQTLLALDPSAGSARSSRLDATTLERARGYLDAHATEAVDSSRLEAVTGLDRFSLARQFRAAFGTSPYNYLVMRASIAPAGCWHKACPWPTRPSPAASRTRAISPASSAAPLASRRGVGGPCSGKSGPETCVAPACPSRRLHA